MDSSCDEVDATLRNFGRTLSRLLGRSNSPITKWSWPFAFFYCDFAVKFALGHWTVLRICWAPWIEKEKCQHTLSPFCGIRGSRCSLATLTTLSSSGMYKVQIPPWNDIIKKPVKWIFGCLWLFLCSTSRRIHNIHPPNELTGLEEPCFTARIRAAYQQWQGQDRWRNIHTIKLNLNQSDEDTWSILEEWAQRYQRITKQETVCSPTGTNMRAYEAA